MMTLRLVVPPGCVVTDRTAAWLWGATMALAPGDHLDVPRVSIFAPPGRPGFTRPVHARGGGLRAGALQGHRGIIRARALAGLLDPASQSAMESISRLRWYDAGLPRPQCQVIETRPDGGWYAIDIGLPGERFGLEFLGEEFHGEAQEADDEGRLEWLREERCWRPGPASDQRPHRPLTH